MSREVAQMAAIDADGRECAKCGEWWPWESFPKRHDGVGVNRRRGQCRWCLASYQHDWYLENVDHVNRQVLAWRLQNPERDAEIRAAAVRRWRARHPERAILRSHRRRALIRGADATLTEGEWAGIIRMQGGCCWYCNALAPLEVEHMTPLSRGGPHSADNIVGACMRCNRRKGAMTAEEFMEVLLAA